MLQAYIKAVLQSPDFLLTSAQFFKRNLTISTSHSKIDSINHVIFLNSLPFILTLFLIFTLPPLSKKALTLLIFQSAINSKIFCSEKTSQ